MAAPMEGKNPDKQASFADNLLDARILCQAHQEGVEPKVTSEKSLHLLAVQLRITRTLELRFELGNLIDQVLESIFIRWAQGKAGNFANGINFKRFAQVIELDDVIALQLRHQHPSTRTLLQETFGGELIHGLANRRTAAAELLSQGKLRNATARDQFSVSNQLLDVQIRLFADRKIAHPMVNFWSPAHLLRRYINTIDCLRTAAGSLSCFDHGCRHYGDTSVQLTYGSRTRAGAMTDKTITGVYAAVLTPRHPDQSVNVLALRKSFEFLIENGIYSYAINGATGEFCLTTAEHLRKLLQVVREVGGSEVEFLCGVGAPGTVQAIEFSNIAGESGAKGLLLPMPYFFPYAQDDLEQFSRTVAQAVTMPFLLYNLPQFTSGLHKDTVRKLISEVPNIVGIKDSSGLLDILRDLTEHKVQACRMVGNDSVLAPALVEGVCDGVISGIACVMPELIQEIYALRDQANSAEFERSSRLLNELIQQLNAFPTPWGLKWLSEARGIMKAVLAQPTSEHRTKQGRDLMKWFLEWHASTNSRSQAPYLRSS
jgi:4-hydroxy-tetrahydrodipicolinate synthase